MKLLLAIILIGAAVGTGIYYLEPAGQKVADNLPPTPSLGASPSPSPTPAPTATPTPSPTAALTSIATLANGTALPKAGPELNLGLTGAVALLGGSSAYYWEARRKLKKSLKNIDIQ